MDLIFTLCSTLFLLIIILSLFLKITTSYKKSSLNLPPGPSKLSIIRNLYKIYGTNLPHHILFDLAKTYGTLMHLRFGEVSTIVVSSPEIAKEIFKTHDDNFSSRPSIFLFNKVMSYDFKDMIFAPYGNYWRDMRKLTAMKLLNPKRVQSFRVIREEEVLNLVRSISLSLLKGSSSSCVNLSTRLFSLTFGIFGRVAFGEKIKDQERYIQLLDACFALASGIPITICDSYPSIKLLPIITGVKRKLESACQEMDTILENILREKEKALGGRDDLVDYLLNMQKNSDFRAPFTQDNVKGIIFDVLNTASGTSSTTIEWAMSEIIRHPSIMTRSQDEVRNLFTNQGNADESRLDELKYLKAILKETLRLHPSGPLLVPRECKEQCMINGYDIPTKARVIINGWAIGRDPRHWKEPERFYPERFIDSGIEYKGTNFAYVPFGAGRRMCPGISFAEPNIMLTLAQLLFHFDWKLPGEMKSEELDMTEGIGLVSRHKNELLVIPLPYPGSFLENKIKKSSTLM